MLRNNKILKYGFETINLYKKYSTIVIVGILVSTVLESVGILMILPLIEGNSNSNSFILKILHNLFQGFGIPFNEKNIIVAILLLFVSKSIAYSVAETYSLKIRLSFHKKIKENLYKLFFKRSLDEPMTSSKYINIHGEELNKATMYIYYFFLFIAHSFVASFYSALVLVNDFTFGIFSAFFGIFLVIIFRYVSKNSARVSLLLAENNTNLNSKLVPFINSKNYMLLTKKTDFFARKYFTMVESNIESRKIAGIWLIVGTSIREPLAILALFGACLVETILFGTSFTTLAFSIVLFYRGLSMLMMAQGWHQRIAENYGSFELIKSLNFQEVSQKHFSRTSKLVDQRELLSLRIRSGEIRRLNGFSLKVASMSFKSGDIIEVCGKSGSGKSTFVESLVSDYMTNTCSIEWFNAKNEYLDKESIKIGFVTQEVHLFPGTIRENILLDEKVEQQKLIDSIEMAGLSDLVNDINYGLDYNLSEDDIALSGGQKQRILLARELYRQVHILILDEATSAIDFATEELIYKAIQKTNRSAIVFILSHGTMHRHICNKKLIVDNGKVFISE